MNQDKDQQVYFEHILKEINYIYSFTKGLTKEEFLSLPEKQHAVIRALEVIGEAANKIQKSLQEKHPQIPWKEIIGTRNKLIHDYIDVDLGRTWNTIANNIPTLEIQIIKILRELKP